MYTINKEKTTILRLFIHTAMFRLVCSEQRFQEDDNKFILPGVSLCTAEENVI